MDVNIFAMDTSYRTEFQGLQNKCKVTQMEKKYDPISSLPIPIMPPVKDLETLSDFRDNVDVPFEMFRRRKESVQTDPNEPFKILKYERVKHEDRLQARRTRPRVYIAPQIALDDIPDDIMYKKNGVADNIYTSDWKQAMAMSEKPMKEWPIQTTLEEGKSNVRFEKSIPYVPIRRGWQNAASKWDKLQCRAGADIDPTRRFWMKNKDRVICTVCKPDAKRLLTEDESQNIVNLVKSNKLRLAYDVLPGYTGFVPTLARGIPPNAKTFTRIDEWLTTNQIMQGRYEKL